MKYEVVDGQWSVENRILQEIHEALTELSARRLEKRDNHTRVVTLIRQWFETPMQIINDGINKIVDENPAPEGWEGADLPVAVLETRQRDILAFKKERQLIKPIPEKALLKDADLPKFIKESLGDRNQFGVGDIMRKLHFVFPMACDVPDAVPDGKDGDPAEEEG